MSQMFPPFATVASSLLISFPKSLQVLTVPSEVSSSDCIWFKRGVMYLWGPYGLVLVPLAIYS